LSKANAPAEARGAGRVAMAKFAIRCSLPRLPGVMSRPWRVRDPR